MTAEPNHPTRHLLGRGFVAALITSTFVGAADGVFAVTRTPTAGRDAWLMVLMVFHCTIALASVGIFIGLLEELLLQSAARRPTLRAIARWVLGGPAQWFARDDRASLAVVMAAITVLPPTGLLLQVTWAVVRTFHSQILVASFIPLASAAMLTSFGLLAVVVAWPLEWLLRRAPARLASPGAALLATALVVGIGLARTISLNWVTYRNLDGRSALAFALVLAVDLLVLSVLTRRDVRFSGRSLATIALGAVGLFLTSGLTLGARQDVVVAVSQRTLGARAVIVPLQQLIDLDGDGYGMLFGGGDCNDLDPTRNRGARDIPDNGVDENCSGADGHRESELSDGRMVPLPPDSSGLPPSFVFLSIDAVRPDHTSLYGYRRNTTPLLSQWVHTSGGARFTRAYCTSPRSLRSFTSIFTGQYPSGVVWGHDNQFPPFDDANTTLAESLRDGGYMTAAFVNSDYFSRTRGFFQGFDERHEGRTFKDDAEPVVAAAEEWLRARVTDSSRPFFSWIHLIDPHDPYLDLESPVDFGHSEVDTYDEGIAHADASAGRLLAVVDEVAQHRPVYVVIFSDHGEAFGEHGFHHHSWDLHEEATRVMLLVRGPGIVPGDRGALASLFDLFPTVLNLAAKRAPAPIPSRSLVGVLLGSDRNGPHGRLYFEVTPDGVISAEQRAVVEPPYKLLYDFQRQSWEFYNLTQDPGETHNRFDIQAGLSHRLQEHLLNWYDTDGLRDNRTTDVVAAARLSREPAMQHPLHINFGTVVELLGFDMPHTVFHVGDSMELTVYIRALGRTVTPASITVMFERVDGQGSWSQFHMQHYPLNGRYMTTQWRPGEMLRDNMARRIDPEVAPGQYRVLFSIEHEDRTTRHAPSRGGRPSRDLELGIIEILP